LRRARGDRRGRLLGTAAVAAGVGSVLYHGPGGLASRRLHDGSAVLLVGAIVAALARRPVGGRATAVVACLAAGGAMHAASRTGRPFCRPDSLFQGHAAWHLLTAAAVVLAAG